MGRLLPILLNAVRWTVSIAWTVLWISAALLVSLLGRRRTALVMARTCWAPGMLRIFSVRVEVSGEEAIAGSGGCLFASNHQSLSDVPALFAAIPRPLHFVAKRELSAVPFLGWYMRVVGMVFIDRHSPSSGVSGTRRVSDLLSAGGDVISFPAGTRSSDGGVQSFKAGAFAAAIEAEAPVVPVAIVGASTVMPPGSPLVRPGLIQIALGEPIPTTGLTRSDRQQLARTVQQRVESLQRELLQRSP